MRLIIHKSIKLKLEVSTMKSLHVSWIIDVYNHIISAAGRDICIKSSMSDEVAKSRENTLVLDPYINTVHHDVTSTSSSSTDPLSITGSMCVIKREDTDDDDSKWKDGHGHVFETLVNDN